MSISEVKAKGDDLELKVGDNKITIEGGAGKKFTFDDGMTKTFEDGLLISGDTVSLTSFFASEIDLSKYEKYDNANAGLLKRAVKLIGGGEDNILIGGKGNDSLIGESGDDTLHGGKGNDTLWGDSPDSDSSGQDTFIFCAGDGTDVIKDYDFDEGDMLEILDKRGKQSTYNKAVFSDGKLTLSIKGGGKVIFEGVSNGDSFNINSTPHQISNKKLI